MRGEAANRRSAILRPLLMTAALAVVALIARLLTVERHLPYVDFQNEPVMYLLARAWRGFGDVPVVADWLNGYPPLYVWMNMGVQQVMEATWPRPWILLPDYIYVLRLVSLVAGVITTPLIAAIGWRLAGPLAGGLAGLIWAVSPVVVGDNSLAIPDPFVYLTCAASIVLAIEAWRRQSPAWLLGSLVAGIAAIYLKYPSIHALVPWAIVTAAMLRRAPRRMIPWIVAEGFLSAAAAYALLFAYGGLNLSNSEAGQARVNGLAQLLDPPRMINNFAYAVQPVGAGIFLAVLLLGMLAWAYARRRGWRTTDPAWVGVVAVYSVAAVLIADTFITIDPLTVRHVLTASVGLIPIWAAGAAQIVHALAAWSRERLPLPQQRWLPIGAAVLIGAAAFLPLLGGLAEMVHRFNLPDTRVLIWRWADENAPLDGRILIPDYSEIGITWNRQWSGYDGVKSFEWWVEPNLLDYTPQEYVERGITYFALTGAERESLLARPETAAFLDQLALLKAVESTAENVGPAIYFYRMLPPTTDADVHFGEQVALVGYDLNTDMVAPGETIRFRPYWRTLRQPDTNYSMFIHLYPAETTDIVAQYDGAPSNPARLTLTWDDPDELYIGPDAELTIPAGTPPGEYRLAVGLYDFTTGQRLLLPGGEDFYVIPIQVQGE